MSSVLLDPITQEKKDVSECSPTSAQPHPASYDSGEEFSLAHFVHDCELIEQEDQASAQSVLDDEYQTVARRFRTNPHAPHLSGILMLVRISA